uniref:U46-Liphistoxin-Lsp1a_1 n=1 Tax=Liphistius sp. SGP-2016 TaxID=1905180 RepID=A0A4Q8K7H9_9ARAC
MKIAFFFVLLSVMIMVDYTMGKLCLKASDCDEVEECCVKIGPVKKCKNFLKAGDECDMLSKESLITKSYNMRCPCYEGLNCKAKEGIIGKIKGVCHSDSGEEE